MIGLLRRSGILSEKESDLRARERDLLDRLSIALERFAGDVNPTDILRFNEAREQLDGFFLLIIAGEFNSGKSTFINSLLGEKILPEGVTPTTDRINVLRYGDQKAEQILEPYLLERLHPAELLREIQLVDTPGTNAIIRKHEELTRDFIPRCDLVLFVTSADRPFTESERLFLEQISQWGKKIMFIINKIDILDTPQERKEVIEFVRSNAKSVVNGEIRIFAVSAREGFIARQNNDASLFRKSGMEEVEEFLLRTLDQKQRVKLKLLSPLNVAAHLATTYKEEAFRRLKLIASDISAIENIDRQMTKFHEEMMEDFEPRLKMLEGLLQDMELRGMNFFDETVQLSQIKMLLKKDKIRSEFERRVIGETPRRVEEEVNRIIDWLVERHLRLWQDVNSYIDRRQIARHRDELIGDPAQGFHYNRQALLNSIERLSQEVIRTYNKDAEARSLANEVHDTFTTTAVAEIGAVGVGALLVVLAHGALADFTGILAASLIAIGGFYIIPRKRKQVKKEFHNKIVELRSQLSQTLTRQVNNEVLQSSERINQIIAPYRRFIKTQQDQLNEAQAELVTLENSLLRMKSEIEKF